MNRLTKSIFIATVAVGAMMFGFPRIGEAQEVLNKNLPIPCEDEISCFGALVLQSSTDNCQNYVNSCINGCATQQTSDVSACYKVNCSSQEISGLRACSTIQDPVAQADCVAQVERNLQDCQIAQANCVAVAQTNFQACQANCIIAASSGYCPPPSP